MKYLASTILFFIATLANAQTYSGGLPVSIGTVITGSVTASRNWYLSGSTDSVAVTGTVSSTQGTSPWVTSRNWLLSNSVDSVGVTGTVSRNWNLSNSVDSVGVTGTVTAGRSWLLSNSVDSVGVTGTVTANATTKTTATVSRVANSASSQTLLSSNSSRTGAIFYNDNSSAVGCKLKFGATASATSFTVKLFATETYIMDPPIYTGVVDFICDSASGSMEATEL